MNDRVQRIQMHPITLGRGRCGAALSLPQGDRPGGFSQAQQSVFMLYCMLYYVCERTCAGVNALA